MASISSLDPAVATNFENIWAVNQLFNGLVQMTDSLKVSPCIAKHWNINEEGKEYEFILRRDVFFHASEVFTGGIGRKVSADDFLYSFNRLVENKASAAASLLEYVDKEFPGTVNGFLAKNDSTFCIRLKEAFSPFLGILTMKLFSVVPREAILKYGEEFRSHPVGTGPFCFKFWEEGTMLGLIKNNNYFEFKGGKRLPFIDAVSVSFIKDKETAFMKLMMGDLDMLSGMDAFNANEVLDADGKLKAFYQQKFYLQSQPYLKTDYLGILIDDSLDIVRSSPLRIKALRQAMNYAFDREKLVKYFRNNIGVAATAGFIPPGLPSFNPSQVIGYTYQPQKVKQLLAEAGFPGGQGLSDISLHIVGTNLEIMEYFQSQLQKNGIKIKISVDQHGELIKATNNHSINFFKKSWICDYPDEENFMSLFYSKNFSPNGFNYTHFKSEAFDGLYEAVRKEQDPEKRSRLYQEMESIIITEAPVIVLYYDQVVRLVSHKVQHLPTNAMNMLNLKEVQMN